MVGESSESHNIELSESCFKVMGELSESRFKVIRESAMSQWRVIREINSGEGCSKETC